MREAHILAGLRHPGVVRLFEVGMAGPNQPFMVLEPLRGELLSRRLARGGVTGRRETRRLLTILASILASAHRAGVLHRDLTADNVVVTEEEPGLKLLGFRRAPDGRMTSPGDRKLDRLCGARLPVYRRSSAGRLRTRMDPLDGRERRLLESCNWLERL